MATIYFATNRDVRFETSKTAKNFGKRFNEAGPQFFRLGKVEVTLNGDPKEDDDWEVGRCELYSEELNSERAKGAKLGSADFFNDLREMLKGCDNDILIYLHGFANDFADTAKRAAALEHLYRLWGAEVMVVPFSWPSDGEAVGRFHYQSDRDDAAASGIAMARALDKLVEFLAEMRAHDRAEIVAAQRRGEVPEGAALLQCERKIHLLAHSMGTWALRHALHRFASHHRGTLPRVIDQCFLMAADEDADALGNSDKLGRLAELATNVHVYHSRTDYALEISDKTKGNPSRLGTDGPANFDRLDERVMAYDCEKVDFTEFAHGRHQYYRLRDEVLSDVASTLQGVPAINRANRDPIRPGRSWRLLNGKTATV